MRVFVAGSSVYWLRFEPFILHVCCRDLVAAAALMAAARSVFKNVGLQGLDSSKLIVAIWGDEGLDMPLTGPDGVPLSSDLSGWLQSLVNSRHQRNWAKIDRFTTAIRQMEEPVPSAEPSGDVEDKELRHFDVVGDIAVVNVKPKEELALVGNAILKQDFYHRLAFKQMSFNYPSAIVVAMDNHHFLIDDYCLLPMFVFALN